MVAHSYSSPVCPQPWVGVGIVLYKQQSQCYCSEKGQTAVSLDTVPARILDVILTKNPWTFSPMDVEYRWDRLLVLTLST